MELTQDRLNQISVGFEEAMYFADGADPDFYSVNDGIKTYDDGMFNRNANMTSLGKDNIKDLVQDLFKRIPKDSALELINSLSLVRIGMCIYYEIGGHGCGFDDENISDELKELMYEASTYYILEVFDKDNEVHFSYWTKGG